MRGGLIFLFLILLLIVNVNALNLTSETITGNPLQAFGLNITITALPALSLLSPQNSTYLTNSSIPLSYSADASVNRIWYNLDSVGNITISSPIYLSVSEGSHILYLYANNSQGITVKNVSFFVNSSKFLIIGNKWKGNSTNFTILSYGEIQNLSNLILEDTNYGKILFNENINLTDNGNASNNQIDIDSNINISSNRIELNSTVLLNFNKSATLDLYGLSFSNPRILRDGSVCPVTICTEESYSGGILRFNVTQFSVYSSEETPVAPPITPSSGGGGGGGGGIFGFLFPKATSFSLDATEIKISAIPGEVITKNIRITNKLNQSLSISLSQENLDYFLIIKENQINLGPRESKDISLDFVVRERTSPDMYLGKLILTDDNNHEKTELLTVIEVQSQGALLDVNAEIQPEYLMVSPNNDVLAKISLLNIKNDGQKRDILVEYSIRNENGESILEDKETVSIETQTSWIKRFKIPSGTAYGKYVLYVKTTTQEGKVASATDTFDVVAPETAKIYILIITLTIIVGGIVIYFGVIRKGKTGNIVKKIDVRDIIKK